MVLDFWHVDMNEKYSTGTTDFRNRGRLVSSETGLYELESIRPIPYRPNPTGAPDFWCCAHFHLVAICPGYQPLVTEIHLQGDPKKGDPMYRIENAISAEEHNVNGRSFRREYSTSFSNVPPGSSHVNSMRQLCNNDFN